MQADRFCGNARARCAHVSFCPLDCRHMSFHLLGSTLETCFFRSRLELCSVLSRGRLILGYVELPTVGRMVFLSVVHDFQTSIRYPSCAQKDQQFVFRLWVTSLGHHAGGYNIWRNPNSSTPRSGTGLGSGSRRFASVHGF